MSTTHDRPISVTPSEIRQELTSIIAADRIETSEALNSDSGLDASASELAALAQSAIQTAIQPGAEPIVVHPQTQEELAAIVTLAHRQGWRMLPCGSGSKLHWGGLATGVNLVISTDRLNRLIDHAVGDLTVTAEAGMRLADLQAILRQQGQFLPIDPAYADRATLGGLVATADAGSLRQRYGGVRDLLIGLSFVRSDGQVAKAGGRVVKNVAGYDLMKLFTGSYGTLGMISQVTLRIYPIPAASRTVVLSGPMAAIATATTTLLAGALTPTAIELVSPGVQAAPGQPHLDQVELIARFQSIAVGVEKQVETLVQVGQTLGLQEQVWSGVEESRLWQQLQDRINARPQEATITCKIGVLPANAVKTIEHIHRSLPHASLVLIHAGSGLGMVRIPVSQTTPAQIVQLRQRCQQHGGFLSVLEAPLDWKQSSNSKVDLWGYTGNAIDLMQRIKAQFDPKTLLSPGRFINGI